MSDFCECGGWFKAELIVAEYTVKWKCQGCGRLVFQKGKSEIYKRPHVVVARQPESDKGGGVSLRGSDDRRVTT